MASYKLVTNPKVIPVPGNKEIDEYLGRSNTETVQYSIAKMIAPPGWKEPAQQPDFDEITIMIRGTMRAVVDDEKVEVNAGEVLLVKKGTKVRYSNPYKKEYECWSVCVPAFSPELVNREKE